MVNKELTGELDLSQNLAKQIYTCFGCLACDEICPAGVHPSDLIMDIRQHNERLHPAAWKNLLFTDLVYKPGRMELATLPLRLYQGSGIRKWIYMIGNMHLFPRRLQDMEAMLPHLPRRPLRKVLPEVTPARGGNRYRVGFFLGCAQSLLFARESEASVRLLARNGCTVITPKEIRCCGMPVVGYGRRDLVQAHARQNIELFEQANVETIITDCATCGSMLKNYTRLLSDDTEWSERAASFSRKVQDISEYLMSIPIQKPQHRIDMRVTYHDPCHLRRGQGVWEQPRSLLKMIAGVDLVELPEAEWCCGSAGSHLITHYNLSRKVMRRKIDNLESTQAKIVASGCPGCQMQLNSGLRRRQLDVQVVHPVELLDWSYRGKR